MMGMRYRSILAQALVPLFCLASCMCSKTTPRKPEWAAPLESEHIENLYKVSDELYRGKQPSREGMQVLEDMGVKTVVNLRTGDSDKELLAGVGLDYEHIPFNTADPDEEEVLRFLSVVTDKARQPVFVHCRRGADRTGMMVAVYRMVVQGWSNERAREEMEDGGYGFHKIWLDIRSYVKKVDADALRTKLAAR